MACHYFWSCFYNAPSALVLYWTVGNFFTLAQLLLKKAAKNIKPQQMQSIISCLSGIGGVLSIFLLLSLVTAYFLPKGLSKNVLLKTLSFYAWIPGLYLLKKGYDFICCQHIHYDKAREKISSHEFSFVILPLIPLMQYMLMNQDALNPLEILSSALLAAFLASMLLIVCPYLLSHLIPKKKSANCAFSSGDATLLYADSR